MTTNPNKNHVYLIEETSDIPSIPAQTSFRKIGILQESIVGDSPFYGRTRALRQGNARDLEVVFSIFLDCNYKAKELEKMIHQRLKKDGFRSLHSYTGKTGHSEWFEISKDEAIRIMNAVYAKYLENLEIRLELWDDISHPKAIKKMLDLKKLAWQRKESNFYRKTMKILDLNSVGEPKLVLHPDLFG